MLPPPRSETRKMQQSRRVFWSRLRYWVPSFLICQGLTWTLMAYTHRPLVLPPTPPLEQLPVFEGRQVREPSNLPSLVFTNPTGRLEALCDLQGIMRGIYCLSSKDSDQIINQELRVRYWKPMDGYPPLVMDVSSIDGRHHPTTYARQAEIADSTRKSLAKGFATPEQILATLFGLMLIFFVSSWHGLFLAGLIDRIWKPND